MESIPTNLLAAVHYFSDLKVCNDYLRGIKWPDGVVCHKCGSLNVFELSTRPVLKCRDCKKQPPSAVSPRKPVKKRKRGAQ